MAKKTNTAAKVRDLREQRQTFLDRLGEQLQSATEGKLPANAGIKSKESHLERLRGRLEDARQAREQAIQRFDHEIETYRGEITRLEREVYQEQAQLQKAEKGSKSKKSDGKKSDGKTTRKVASK